MADPQQRSLLAMLLSGGGRGDPYANQAAGPFASSPRVYGQSPAFPQPVPIQTPIQGPVPVPLPRPMQYNIPIPIPRPNMQPPPPPQALPYNPLQAAVDTAPNPGPPRYAGSPDPMSGRYMPWIRW